MLTGDVSDLDLIAVAATGRALGIDPVDVLKSTYFESAGFHPGAKNASGCVGLNQFCGETFRGSVPGMSPDDYRALTAAEQLERYIAPFWLRALGKRTLADAADLEWLNFKPAEYKPGQGDDAVVTDKPGDLAANPSFVHDGKAIITRGDLRRTLDDAAKAPRFVELAARLAALSAVVPPPPPGPTKIPTPELVAGAALAAIVGIAVLGGGAKAAA